MAQNGELSVVPDYCPRVGSGFFGVEADFGALLTRDFVLVLVVFVDLVSVLLLVVLHDVPAEIDFAGVDVVAFHLDLGDVEEVEALEEYVVEEDYEVVEDYEDDVVDLGVPVED